MLSRFVTRGTVSATLAVVCFWLSKSGHSTMAEALKAQSEEIMGLLGSALMIYAGVAQGVERPSEAATMAKELAPNIHDPYPGYDWDPVRGWVALDTDH